MVEAAMMWNEPNNNSHWDFELDPGWTIFARMVNERRRRDSRRKPASAARTGRHVAHRSAVSRPTSKGRGVLEHVDAVAVHGFPLDWNHWAIDDWPSKLDEIRAGDRPSDLGERSRCLDIRSGGGAGLGPAAYG